MKNSNPGAGISALWIIFLLKNKKIIHKALISKKSPFDSAREAPGGAGCRRQRRSALSPYFEMIPPHIVFGLVSSSVA
jgi:hypothetical protein